MSTEGQRKCCHCATWFKPDPRNTYHQRFCRKKECQAASKAASQKKWCRRNPSYFRGEGHVRRVRDWRKKHPGYWRREGAGRGGAPPDALQEVLFAQGFDYKDIKVFRNCLFEEISRPLQDVLSAQRHALVGLTAMITGDVLQDDIVRALTTCYEHGQRINPDIWKVGMPWMQKQEVSHERTQTDHTGTKATCSPAV